ncbi:rRNA maturation RNase YbeY [Enterobacteriaceae endosymbiont of Donacia cincticornis]|uniref:rRNA maturation RNase YbeY n=1 Tax=Enterobacteriaceae endosymbiont of Donacia cincticornis TaxID=2675773 RepID=UPI001448A719|nr:rRNA maturation RNase YbeY [Enterobacteriaceae endosymbiont of Donacia cincticornis]QJC36175.1 rRNA maturation RNase YbeY [Enterobacteriaceae endosymbiont of Donacia cincticornis]
MKLNILLNYYNFCKNCYRIPYKNDILYWLSIIFLKTKIKKIEITISIVEKYYIQQLNKKHFQISKPTNVLSFLEKNNSFEKKLSGEIILCKEIIEYESFLQKRSLNAHWAHMIIHACLHLLKYDHKNIQEACIMQIKEINILNLLGYKNPYY